MTGKADFTAEEWETIAEGPPSAGLYVVTAQRGGTIRETLSIAKSYVKARQQHGESELLDAIVSGKPDVDHTRHHSIDELRAHALDNLHQALQLLEQKATPDEVTDYKQFVLNLAQRVADAHREGILGLTGERVSDHEQQAISDIAATLGVPSTKT